MKATVENLSQTPRRLGLFNILGLYTYGPGCLARTLGAILILIAALAGLRDYWTEKTAFRDPVVAKGKVSGTDYTSWSFNDREQQIVYFKYDWNGQPREGFSYTQSGSWGVGKEVDIEIDPGNPNVARIAGLDFAQFHFFVYFPAILALLFAIGAVIGMLKTYRWGRLLERGAVTEAELQNRASLNKKKQSGMPSLKFHFTDASGQTHEVDTGYQPKLKTPGNKIIFYDPANPKRNLFLDVVPNKLRLAEPGRWAPPNQKGQIVGWFLFTFGLLLWAIYVIAKLG